VVAALEAEPAVARVVDPASLQRDLTGGDPLALFELAAERDELGDAARTFTAIENMSWVVRDVVGVLNGQAAKFPAP